MSLFRYSLSAPPVFTRSLIQRHDSTIAPPADTLAYKDVSVRDIDTTSSTKTSSTANTPSSTPTWEAGVIIGNQRQHVGGLRGQNLIEKIKGILDQKCPRDKTGHICMRDEATIENIDYSNKGWIYSNSYLQIHVLDDYIPKDHPQIRDLLIKQAADTFGIAPMDEKNCYNFDYKKNCPWPIGPCPNRYVKWCNTANDVVVRVKDPTKDKGNKEAYIHVSLSFNGQTLEGRFDCVAIMEAVGKNLNEKIGDIESIIGETISGKVNCPNRTITGS